MKQLMILILIVIVFVSCSEGSNDNQYTKTSKLESTPTYPRIVDSLHIQDLYDSARWWTYCINCDDTCVFYPPSKNKNSVITFGETELRSESITLHNIDTVEFTFDFYQDTQKCFHIDGYRPYASFGIVYKISNKEALYMMIYGGLTYFVISGITSDDTSRYFVPLQPDVIKYLNDNKAKINPWFYKEAKKRGVIKD